MAASVGRMPAMAIRLRFEKAEAVCDSAAEAAELLKALGLASANGQALVPSSRGRGRPPINGIPAKKSREMKDRKIALAFLGLLNGGPATAEAVVESLHLNGTRGIGSALTRVRRVIEIHGIQPSADVFRMIGARGKRRWEPGRQLLEAIAVIEDKNGGETP